VAARPDAHHINLAWLVRLRWLVWAGHAGLLGWAVVGLGIRLQVGWVSFIIVLGLTSNAWGWLWLKRGGVATGRVLLGVMLTDTALQTAYFFFTGGPFNPFTALYLVNLVLGTLVLSRVQQWAQLAVSFLAFASLFWLEKVAPESLRLPNHQELMRLHLAGMLVAFAVAAAFIVYFMQRVQQSLKAREAELEGARKLAALTTLAAGAAHELATPLGTIALVSKELERALARVAVPPECLDDVRLLRAQVERCRGILRGMSASSGELAGEVVTRFGVEAWLADAVAQLPAPARVTMSSCAAQLNGPRQALTQALRNLVRNALEAAPPPGVVQVVARREGGLLLVEVVDSGKGCEPALLARVGEPFFTTKEPGQGMGLGVFLARTLAEQLGGSLAFESTLGRGTTARFALPLH
jgi:two-component system sensor histidine kinase RegB